MSQGSLTVYYGCMFAGKTTALISHLENANLKAQELLVLKPDIDNRSGHNTISTHNGKTYECLKFRPEDDIFSLITPYTRLIALDEAQFFDKLLLDDLKRILKKGIDIVASGLDRDYKNRPFGPMPDLIGMADHSHKLWAECEVCRQPADHTFRKTQNSVLLLIGAEDHYEARCGSCFSQ